MSRKLIVVVCCKKGLLPAVEVTWCWFVFNRNGVEEPMEEPVPETDPEPEPEPKVEDIKPEVDEKALEALEERASSPAPVETPPNVQEPPKVKLALLKCTSSFLSLYSLYIWPSEDALGQNGCICDPNDALL